MSITQTGATWATNQFNTSAVPATQSSHYVEILSDGNALHTGMILDIVSNSASGLQVEVPAGFVPGGATTYAIRKHVTLGELLGDGSGVAANEDLVLLLDQNGADVNAVYQGAGVWVDALNPATNLSSWVLYPGQGFFFLPSDMRTLTIGGGAISYVKEGQTRISLTSGVPTLVGLINPLVSTDPLDAIFSTTAVNTLSTFGLTGMSPDTDIAVRLSDDGVLDTLNNISLDSASGNLIDVLSGANLNAASLRNGQALLYIPGDDISFVLPQRH